MKKVLFTFLAILLLTSSLSINPGHVHAMNATLLEFNQEINGAITTDSSEQTYKLVVPEAGFVCIDLIQRFHSLNFDILDENGNKIIDTKELTTYDPGNQPIHSELEYELKAGTYYIRLSKSFGFTGDYRLFVEHFPAGKQNTETSNNTITSAQQLELNKKPITGFISSHGKKDYYKLTLREPGFLSIQLKQYFRWFSFNLLDEKGAPVVPRNTLRELNTLEPTPAPDLGFNLTPGTYYILLSKDAGGTGKYELAANFNPVHTGNTKPNNSIEDAQPIEVNKAGYTRGFISELDHEDFYKFTLAKDAHILLDMNQFVDYLSVGILNSTGTEIMASYGERAEDGASLTAFGNDIELKAGTYYLRVFQYENYTGAYDFSVKANYVQTDDNKIPEPPTKPNDVNGNGQTNPPVEQEKPNTNATKPDNSGGSKNEAIQKPPIKRNPPKAPTVNKVTNNTTSLTGQAENNTTVYAYVGKTKIGSAKVINGKFNITIKVQKANTTITLYAQDTTGNKSANITITVEAILAMPKVNEVNNKSKSITGTTVKNSTVTAKIKTKTYTAKSNNQGKFTINVPNQAAGQVIHIAVTDLKGNTSSTQKVTVVDRIPPKKPTINKITTKTTSITGSTEKDALVYAYVGKKEIGSAKANNQGKYTIQVARQKKNTTILVYAEDKSKNRSTTASLKVK